MDYGLVFKPEAMVRSSGYVDGFVSNKHSFSFHKILIEVNCGLM